MKKILWNTLGILSLVMAYIGVITPGLPYSPFVVFAAYCFSNGSETLHNWIYNHKLFGPFLTNWTEKRVFPLKMKYMMLITMSVSLAMMFIGNVHMRGIIYTALFMLGVAVWAWRYPSSVDEYNRRIAQGEKIGWIR